MLALLAVFGFTLVTPAGGDVIVPATAASQVVAGAGEDSGPSPVTLPHKSFVHADGSIEVVADPKAVAATAARYSEAVEYDCGYYCDGKDPNSLLVVTPSGNFYCATDATTIYTRWEGADYAELRYSRRCRTAWTRGCCYQRLAGFGYHSSGQLRSSVFNYQGVNSGSRIWTAMLYDAGSLTYEACYDLVVAGSGNDWRCTVRF